MEHCGNVCGFVSNESTESTVSTMRTLSSFTTVRTFYIVYIMSTASSALLTTDLAAVAEGDVLTGSHALQLQLLLQEGHSHQVEHLSTAQSCQSSQQESR